METNELDNKIIIYQTDDGKTQLDVKLENENGILYDDMHNQRIDDATLVALTLLIAESRPEEKDTMVKVVVNLIGHTSI